MHISFDDRLSASKENFLRLKKMILIGGKDDGVITPWQSRYIRINRVLLASSCTCTNCSHFSFFGEDNLTVVPMKQQQVRSNQ